MNPEDNNPFSNAGSGSGSATSGNFDLNPVDLHSATSGAGLVIPEDNSGLSPADSLASTGDELHSMALHGADLSAGLDGSSTAPVSLPAPDTPLTPAAPVPGSIGSAMSVPAEPKPAAMFGEDNSASGSASAASAGTFSVAHDDNTLTNPSATPAPAPAAPYNPFAPQPSAAAPSAQPTSATPTNLSDPASSASTFTSAPAANPFATSSTTAVNPAAPASANNSTASSFQPITPDQASAHHAAPASMSAPASAAAKKAAAHSPIVMIVMAVALAVAVIVALIFAILFFKARSEQEKVYVAPPTNNGISQNEVKEVTCETSNDASSTVVVMNFTGKNLKHISITSNQFADSADAAVSLRDVSLATRQVQLQEAGRAEDPLALTITAENNQVTLNGEGDADQLNLSDAELLSLATNPDGSVILDKDTIVSGYEGQGFVCSE